LASFSLATVPATLNRKFAAGCWHLAISPKFAAGYWRFQNQRLTPKDQPTNFNQRLICYWLLASGD